MLGEMGGKEANHKFLEIDSAAKIIISSGYSSNPIMSEYEKYGFSAVVTKLYDIDTMEKTLHEQNSNSVAVPATAECDKVVFDVTQFNKKVNYWITIAYY